MAPVFAFFLGSGRSGTTLLRRIFDSHPDLAVAHEAHFVTRLAFRRERYRGSRGFDLERFLEDLYRSGDFQRMEIERPALEDWLRAADPPDYSEAVRAVFRLYAQAQGKTRYGDKTPGYVNHLPLLARLFPEARFVHIIRDGRNVTLSYLERDWGPGDVAEGAFHWRSRVSRGRKAGRRLGSGRYREVLYEELVEDPHREVRELCGFLDLRFEPSMLRYFEHAEEFARDTKHPGAHTRLVLPPTAGLRDWRQEMPSKSIELFEAIAGPLLDELGYPRGSARISMAARLRATWLWLRWQGTRVRSRGRTWRRRLLV